MAYIFYGFLAIVTIIITFRIFNSFRSTDDILKREDEKFQAEEELQKFKDAARLQSYSSYSEFVRRTALVEANRVIAHAKADKKEEAGT